VTGSGELSEPARNDLASCCTQLDAPDAMPLSIGPEVARKGDDCLGSLCG
jgi:hypothetical protein